LKTRPNIYNFTDGFDGTDPMSLIVSGNTIYGVALSELGSGESFGGTVFSLLLGATSVSATKLDLNLAGTNVVLTWSATGYTLQSATNLAAPVWITVPGQNTVINPISGTQKFYRLSQ
jgi:hypothetical protein